ncbi:hypothetical protein T492DRAFT_202350 [Pavlovales sp. CCMP2436]|nr:hypothetical protein T492DRAFT_202350 [Pavlovales sp. CCMP2436]
MLPADFDGLDRATLPRVGSALPSDVRRVVRGGAVPTGSTWSPGSAAKLTRQLRHRPDLPSEAPFSRTAAHRLHGTEGGARSLLSHPNSAGYGDQGELWDRDAQPGQAFADARASLQAASTDFAALESAAQFGHGQQFGESAGGAGGGGDAPLPMSPTSRAQVRMEWQASDRAFDSDRIGRLGGSGARLAPGVRGVRERRMSGPNGGLERRNSSNELFHGGRRPGGGGRLGPIGGSGSLTQNGEVMLNANFLKAALSKVASDVQARATAEAKRSSEKANAKLFDVTAGMAATLARYDREVVDLSRASRLNFLTGEEEWESEDEVGIN